jgi:hypothetical protein
MRGARDDYFFLLATTTKLVFEDPVATSTIQPQPHIALSSLWEPASERPRDPLLRIMIGRASRPPLRAWGRGHRAIVLSGGMGSTAMPWRSTTTSAAPVARLMNVGPNIWLTKGYFNLGEGGTGKGLQYSGLKDRLLDRIAACPGAQHTESTSEELSEERRAVSALQQGEHVPFVLDTAMFVIRHGDDQISIRSVCPFDQRLADEVSSLGTVTSIIAASLQHWLFVPQWKAAFPQATVYVTPAAFGEDLRVKLGDLGDEAVELCDVVDGAAPQISTDVEQLLFRGAPLNANETIFFHKPSRSLLVDDAFYGGYSSCCHTSWFARTWFKATKNGSFRSAELPIYRTSRVHTHGDVAALASDLEQVASWDIQQVLYTHGASVCTTDAKNQFLGAWQVVLDEAEEMAHAEKLAAA